MKNKLFKRILASVLAVVMVVNTGPELLVRAETVYEETTVYNLEDKKKELLESENISDNQAGTVTFPLTGAALKLGEELIFHVFRQGSTDEKQTVTLATADLSAGYGKDYELLVDGEVIDGKANILLDGKNITYDIYMDGNGNVSGQTDETNMQETLTEEELEELTQEMFSSQFDVTFEEGEQIKELRIRAKRPANTTVDKQFQLIMMECQDGLEAGEVHTTVISLCETREVAESEISIVKDSVKVENGYVTVLVKRKGNTEGYETYDISAEDGSAVNGEDYILKPGQLMFTPGVTKQRIHIPLVSSEKTETKDFIVKAAQSEVPVTYQTMRTSTQAFQTSREYISVPWDEFTVQGNNLGAYEFYRQDENERYIIAADSGIGDGDCRTLSIRSGQKYDFTGIKGIRFSASYAIGTVAGDFLNVYASNEDFYDSTAQLDAIDDNEYGDSYGVTSLDGQALLTAPVNRAGEYFVYVTMQQHTVLGGHIEYNLYDQEFDGGKKGHLALMKEDYTIELLGPDSIGTTVPAGDFKLTLNSDHSVSGDSVKAYRDESFTLSYTLLDSGTTYAGYEIVDKDDKVIYEKETTDPIFVLSSEILNICKGRLHEDTIKIRPVFERRKAELSVKKQDFEGLGMEGLSANLSEENGEIKFFDNGEEISTVTWNVSGYENGSTVNFEAEDNPDYAGDYHFTAYKVVSGNSPDFGAVNPLYHMGRDLKITIEEAYYEIVPMVSNINADFYLNVTGANHGTFTGEPQGQTSDTYVMKDYNGKYEPTDIAIFNASPDEGYRAKWSYRDVATGETKTYYGSTFYYRLQFPSVSTDNYVNLEFEKNSNQKDYTIAANVYMQAGDVLHANANQDLYHPLKDCQVTVEKMAGKTDEAGKTTLAGVVSTVKGASDEKHTALLLANNRYYIEEIDFSKANDTTVCQEMKLPYYYDGPSVTDIRYIDYNGVSQNGDTIFLDGETDGCIFAAKIDNRNKEITDVVYKIKDSTGAQKGENYKAERNGDEYIWSTTLGLRAEEGDQIFIELFSTEYAEDGTIKKQVSYGEVNTGYEIVVAEFSEASYIPDIGVPEFRKDDYYSEGNSRASSGIEIADKIFSGFGCLFVFKGLTPVFNTSTSGNVTFLNFGMSWSAGGKRGSGEASIIHFGDWVDFVKAGLTFVKPGEASVRETARQELKLDKISVGIPVSAQLAFYTHKDESTQKEKLLVIGGGITVGVNFSYTFNYPFLFAYTVPMFVSTTFTFAFSDSLQFGPADEQGYVNLENINDPRESEFTGGNKMNVTVSLNVSVGVGANGIASVSGGGTGALIFDFVEFGVGAGNASLAGEIRIEALIVGKTFVLDDIETELFNNIPTEESRMSQNGESSSQADRLVLEQKLDELNLRSMEEYNQQINVDSSGGDTVLIKDAYEFSRPKIYPAEEDKYIVVATVDSKYVVGCTEEGRPVLSYAIYDKDRYVGMKDGKVFRSIEPEDTGEKSINFNPSITEISDEKYMITWNTVFYNEEKELKLHNMRSVIRSAVLDVSDENNITYNSLVLMDEDGEKLHTGVVTNTVYDKNNEEVVMLYRAMNFEGLDASSTIADYGKAGTTLYATSIKVDDKSLEDDENTWRDSVEIIAGGNGQVIKNVDLAMMNGIPVLTYHKIKGENLTVFNEGGDETNHIVLTSLKHTASGYIKDYDDELKIDQTEYNATPQLATGIVDGEEMNLLMWKQGNRVAAANVLDILNGKIYNQEAEGTGLSVINRPLAGNMDDINLFTGEDGKLYCTWTEGKENGSSVMMSVLDKQGDSVSWGQGTEVCATDSKKYVMSISPVVNEKGEFMALYRQTDLSDEKGYSEIHMHSSKLGARMSVSDEHVLDISNTTPKAGEIITVTAKVENTGVGVLNGETLELEVDGEKSGVTVEVPELSSGEETYVEFEYTVPENVSRQGAVLSVGNVRQSVSADAVVGIEDLKMEELNLAEEGEASEFTVTAQLSNTGNNVAQNLTAVLSRVDYITDEDNNDEVVETVLGTGSVPVIRPNMNMPVSFNVSIPEEMFQTTEIFKLAPVHLAVYENYGTENQRMLTFVKDYAEATSKPEVETVSTNLRQTIGVSQKDNFYTVVTPGIAQLYAGLTYKTSDETIATVDDNGIVTGVKEGRCEITVTSRNGKSATTEIVVQKKAVEDEEKVEPIIPGDEPIKDEPIKDKPEKDDSVNDDTKEQLSANSGKTGDESGIILWSILFVAMLSIIIVVGKKKFR